MINNEKTLRRCMIRKQPLEGYEDATSSWLYIQNMNPVCIFGHQINKEQLKGCMSIGNIKKIHIDPKQAYALGSMLRFCNVSI